MRQGQIWIADLPMPIGRRPVLVLTRTSAIPTLHNVTVATISTNIRNVETEVVLGPADGMARRCAVSCDNIHTLRVQYLDRAVAELSPERMSEVFQAIRNAFDMPI